MRTHDEEACFLFKALFKSSSVTSQVHPLPCDPCSAYWNCLSAVLLIITARDQDIFLLGTKGVHETMGASQEKRRDYNISVLKKFHLCCSQPACRAYGPSWCTADNSFTAGDREGLKGMTYGLKGMTHLKLQGKPTGEVAVLLTGVGNIGVATWACPLKCHLLRNDTKVSF